MSCSESRYVRFSKKIKNEPFFRWPNKMAGNPIRHNQNLYCHYHQDQGQTTKDFRNLWDHLDQLVRKRKLKQLLHHSSGQGGQINLEPQRDDSSRLLIGMINFILTALGRTGSYPSNVMFVARLPAEESDPKSKRARMDVYPTLSFRRKIRLEPYNPMMTH